MVPHLASPIHRALETYYQHLGKLCVFDFDDTLVKTGSRVFLTRACGARVIMTPAQFVSHVKEAGDVFDFCEFRELIDPRPIDDNVNLLRDTMTSENTLVVILTARSTPRPVELFLDLVGIVGIDVIALGDADPRAKVDWIATMLATGSFDELQFYDDSLRNVRAVEALGSAWPTVMFRCHHVTTEPTGLP